MAKNVDSVPPPHLVENFVVAWSLAVAHLLSTAVFSLLKNDLDVRKKRRKKWKITPKRPLSKAKKKSPISPTSAKPG